MTDALREAARRVLAALEHNAVPRSSADEVQIRSAAVALRAAIAAPAVPTVKESLTVAPAVPHGWQPIETAPKDGTDIMLSNGVVVAEGHWLHREGGITERRDLDGRYIDQDEDEGYDGWIDWFGGMLPEPTHWMPLPAQPTRAEGAP